MTSYRSSGKAYTAYLQGFRGVYEQLRRRMKPAGTAILEVANPKRDGQMITLARDVAREVSQVLSYQGEKWSFAGIEMAPAMITATVWCSRRLERV